MGFGALQVAAAQPVMRGCWVPSGLTCSRARRAFASSQQTWCLPPVPVAENRVEKGDLVPRGLLGGTKPGRKGR